MDAKQIPSIGRSNTVFGSLKLWASTSFSSSSKNVSLSTTESTGPSSSSGKKCGSASIPNGNKNHFGSAVISVQKLRESKWFGGLESRLFCAVIENGFVVEIKAEGQENESTFGVVQFKCGKDKKPKTTDVDVFTIKFNSRAVAETTGRLLRLVRKPLVDLWQKGCLVRINNFGDKEHQPHSEKDIRNQITFAQKTKQMLWSSTQHFTFWCRYGERQKDVRRKQISECIKWGSVGMNAGMMLIGEKAN